MNSIIHQRHLCVFSCWVRNPACRIALAPPGGRPCRWASGLRCCSCRSSAAERLCKHQTQKTERMDVIKAFRTGFWFFVCWQRHKNICLRNTGAFCQVLALVIKLQLREIKWWWILISERTPLRWSVGHHKISFKNALQIDVIILNATYIHSSIWRHKNKVWLQCESAVKDPSHLLDMWLQARLLFVVFY